MAESKLISSTRLDELQNHEDFRIVWLYSDGNALSQPDKHFFDYFQQFDSWDQCMYYIESFESERKIFIVLTDFFDYLPYVNGLSQIHRIYILDKLSQCNLYGEKYSKLVNIFINENELIERIRQDILLTYRDDLPITISHLKEMQNEQSLTNLDDTMQQFIWHYLFVHYLVNASEVDMNQLKQVMIEQSRLEYRNNKNALVDIQTFDNDCELDIIKWYTRDSFVYRLLNKAFRTRNVAFMCKFQYAFILLYRKLQELSIEQQQKMNRRVVYRGQIMKENDLENLRSNIGNLISINTITSTTYNREVACHFFLGAESGVLFEIDLGKATDPILHPFAEIFQLSAIKNEEEVLVFAGAVFCIDSVIRNNDSMWTVKLTLSKTVHEHMALLMNIVTKQYLNKSYWTDLINGINDFKEYHRCYKFLTNKKLTFMDLLKPKLSGSFYYIINNFGNYKKIIEHFEKLLIKQSAIDESEFIIVHIMIGHNYFHLHEFDKALDYYNIALSFLVKENQLQGELNHHIGDVWMAMDSNENALSSYKNAINNFVRHGIVDRHKAVIYRKMSNIYLKQNNVELAIVCKKQADELDNQERKSSEFDYKTALRKYEDSLSKDSSRSFFQHAHIQYSMGYCLMKNGDHSQALEKFLLAKQLFEDQMPPTHYFIKYFGTLFENIGLTYLFLDDPFNALLVWKKAIDMRTAFTQFQK